MIRGYKKFVCDNCGHKFRALDIEWQATIYSTPQVCPQCGSRHTLPWSLFGWNLDKFVYKSIWKDMDEHEK